MRLSDKEKLEIDIVVVDKQRKTAAVIDVAIPSDINIRKKEYKKLEKYQRLREEKMWRMKATVVPVVFGALSDPQARTVVPVDHRINIQDICPKERSPSAQNPQAVRPLVDYPSLKDKDRPQG